MVEQKLLKKSSFFCGVGRDQYRRWYRNSEVQVYSFLAKIWRYGTRPESRFFR
jgi:hypothetical protein